MKYVYFFAGTFFIACLTFFGLTIIHIVQDQAQVDDSSITVTAEPTTEVAEALDPATQWVYDTAEAYGLTFGDVPVYVVDVMPEECAPTAGGCVELRIKVGTDIVTGANGVYFRSDFIGTETGRDIVLHELGHIYGNKSDCAADDFAIALGANPNPVYGPQCGTL